MKNLVKIFLILCMVAEMGCTNQQKKQTQILLYEEEKFEKIEEKEIKPGTREVNIELKKFNKNKKAFTTPGNGSLYDAIECIYGTKVSEELLPIEAITDDIKVTGFISKPAIIRSSRSWQTFVINGRVVNSRIISKAIDNAYH